MSSSSAADPKPSVVTGYPATAAAAAAASTAAPATAYPYPAPPPHAVPAYYHANGAAGAPPPPYYPPPHPAYYPAANAADPRSSAAFLRRILAVFIAFFLLIGLATVILWLVLRPRIPEVYLSAASVSGFNLSASRLSGAFDAAFSFRNPNGKMGVYYDRLAAAVVYDTDTLADTSLPPFYQGKGNTTDVRASLVAESGYVDPNAAKGIEADRGRGDGVVGFNFRVLAWVRFRSGAWRTRRHMMRVYCDDVKIGFGNATSSSGKLVSPSPHKCGVNL